MSFLIMQRNGELIPGKVLTDDSGNPIYNPNFNFPISDGFGNYVYYGQSPKLSIYGEDGIPLPDQSLTQYYIVPNDFNLTSYLTGGIYGSNNVVDQYLYFVKGDGNFQTNHYGAQGNDPGRFALITTDANSFAFGLVNGFSAVKTLNNAATYNKYLGSKQPQDVNGNSLRNQASNFAGQSAPFKYDFQKTSAFIQQNVNGNYIDQDYVSKLSQSASFGNLSGVSFSEESDYSTPTFVDSNLSIAPNGSAYDVSGTVGFNGTTSALPYFSASPTPNYNFQQPYLHQPDGDGVVTGRSVAVDAPPTDGEPAVLAPNQSGFSGATVAVNNPENAASPTPELGAPVDYLSSGAANIDTSALASDAPPGSALGGASGNSGYYSGGVSYGGGSYGQGSYGGYNGGSYGGGSYGGYGGGSYGGSYGPVVLDLTGGGIKITPKTSSNMFYDMAGDGYQHHTAWAGAGNGVLVLDTQGNGKITQQNQVVFTAWDPTAKSDMQALLDVFDTNHNGKLDSGDAQFSKFKIMVTNADGTTTLETLAQAGISSINLTTDKTKQVLADGSSIDGETTFTRTNGTTGTAATVSLAFDGAASAVKNIVTHNADGSTTIDNKSMNPDGSLAGEIKTTTSADGLTKTTTFDNNGDGVVDDSQSDKTVINGDGSRTETLTDSNAASVLLNRTVTTTSADGKTVTIQRDPDGNGVIDQSETDVTNSDGSKTVTITNLNPNGSVKNSLVHSVSADGLTSTTKTDLDGNGVYDLTTVDQTVTNGDGSHTETLTDTNADGSLRDKTITTTSADNQTKTIQTDTNGDGVYDLTRTLTTVPNVRGGRTTTQVDKSANGTILDTITTMVSADGLTTITQKDLNGDGTVDYTHTDGTTIDAQGNRTETITDTNTKGALLDKTVIVSASDGLTRTTSVDTDGNGTYDNVDQVTVGTGGVITETRSSYESDGRTLKNRTITTTSADGLTQTIQTDLDGDGKIDRTSTIATTKNGDGSATTTTSDRSANNALIDSSVATTSADKTSGSTKLDLNGDGTFELSTPKTTVINADGSQTTTVTTLSPSATVTKTVTTISADRNTTTIQTDTNGDGSFDQIEKIAKHQDGSIVDTTTNYTPGGVLVSSTATTTTANGLSKTTQVSTTGSQIDLTTTDNTVLNNDGSRTETVSVMGQNGVLRSKTITTTSANGLSIVKQNDVDGNGSIDITDTSTTVINADGGKTTTVKETAGNTLLQSTVTTVSGNGLSKTTTVDANGDGTIDTTTTDVTTLNADGTTTETVTNKNANGSVRDQTVTTLSSDHKMLTVNHTDGTYSNVKALSWRSDGSVLEDDTTFQNGNKIQDVVKSTNPNGRSYSLNINPSETTVTESQNEGIVYNADGSSTNTFTWSDSRNDNVTNKTTTSANSLTKTISVTGTIYGNSASHTSIDSTVFNSDGTNTETRTVTNATAMLSKEVTTTADNGSSKTVQLDEYGTGVYNQTDATVLNSDGSTTETFLHRDKSGNLTEKDVTTTSANGRTITIQRDTDGDGNFDQFKTTSYNPDGSRTDTIATRTNAGVLTSQSVETTSADGRSQTTQLDTNGDGVTDETITQVSVVNADGSTTQTRSELNANGTLRDRTITTTSANGFSINGVTDLNGDGVVDETFSNNVILNADGTKTATVQTNYADGTLKSKSVTTTSTDGLTITTNEDLNGDGKIDVSEVDATDVAGMRTVTITHYDAAGKTISSITTTSSLDGTSQTTNGTNVAFEEILPKDNGSYHIETQGVQGTHWIDENGVDQMSVGPLSGGTLTTKTATTAEEAKAEGEVTRLYDVTLDRNASIDEKQSYVQYANYDALVSAVTTSKEFSQKYGSLTNAQFVEQMYQNAYGRSASLAEMSSWLNQLAAGTTTKIKLIETLADSAEHLAIGNTHAVTNNTQNVTGTYSLDHTMDKMVAGNMVDRLYLTALNRHADTAGRQTNAQAILNGTSTEANIANSLITSTEFQQDYGTLTNSQFVNRIYQNALGRAATSQELSTWGAMLDSGALSRADFVVAIADSSDHLAVLNGGSAPQAPAQASPATQTASVSHAKAAISSQRASNISDPTLLTNAGLLAAGHDVVAQPPRSRAATMYQSTTIATHTQALQTGGTTDMTALANAPAASSALATLTNPTSDHRNSATAAQIASAIAAVEQATGILEQQWTPLAMPKAVAGMWTDLTVPARASAQATSKPLSADVPAASSAADKPATSGDHEAPSKLVTNTLSLAHDWYHTASYPTTPVLATHDGFSTGGAALNGPIDPQTVDAPSINRLIQAMATFGAPAGAPSLELLVAQNAPLEHTLVASSHA